MKKNPYSGKFIALEGLDGSGQTTQAKLLQNFIKEKGVDTILTKEPTWENDAGTWINNALRENKKLDLDELKLLQEKFAEDRKWHQKNIIEPALKNGKIVISDRSQFSSFAFGAASGIDINHLFALNNKFISPDIVILLKVSPSVCMKRIQQRAERKALFEKEKQLEKVWEVYEKLAKRFKNIIIVDGEKTIEEVHKEISQIIKKIL